MSNLVGEALELDQHHEAILKALGKHSNGVGLNQLEEEYKEECKSLHIEPRGRQPFINRVNYLCRIGFIKRGPKVKGKKRLHQLSEIGVKLYGDSLRLEAWTNWYTAALNLLHIETECGKLNPSKVIDEINELSSKLILWLANKAAVSVVSGNEVIRKYVEQKLLECINKIIRWQLSETLYLNEFLGGVISDEALLLGPIAQWLDKATARYKELAEKSNFNADSKMSLLTDFDTLEFGQKLS